jgi:hypothetical protein
MMEAAKASETLDCSSILTQGWSPETILLHLVAAKASSYTVQFC